MILRRKKTELREEITATARRASQEAMRALWDDDAKRAREELSAAPKKLDFVEIGWRVALVAALVDMKTGKFKSGVSALEKVIDRLDETDLSRDDKGYLRLFALYRASDAAKDNRAPASLRERVEHFRFDQTLVAPEIRADFPLKKIEDKPVDPPPPPMATGGPEF